MAVLLIRRRQLPVRVCLCLLLLLAVAPPPPMVAGEGDCYWTAMHVPRWCRAEFIKALFNNDHMGIRNKCCFDLVCVDDPPCFKVLSEYCDYWRWIRLCKFIPPQRLGASNSSAPAPTPGHHHH